MSDAQPCFRVMLRMQIRSGMEKEFQRTWYQIGQAVTDHQANLGQWLARSEEEEGVYYIVSDWTDEPSFREFEHSDRHLEHRQRLHPFRSGGSMTTMRVVYSMTGAAAG
jgi:heme-degrading monooxygenase HmoA